MVKYLFALPMIVLVPSCAFLQPSGDTLIDVRKIYSEYPRLVEKILPFRERDFKIQVDKDSRQGEWQSWELNKGVAKRYKLEWLRLRFEKSKLRTIWFGPRRELEPDLKMMGMIPFDLTSKSGKRLETYDLGEYRSQEFSGRRITIEYDVPHSQGITVRRF